MRRLRSGAIVLLSISSVRNHERSALDTQDGRITDSENLFLTAPRSIRTDPTAHLEHNAKARAQSHRKILALIRPE